MKTVVIIVSWVTVLAVGFVASFKGLDLRRKTSWLYGVISFLGGFALIMGQNGNVNNALVAGCIFAFLTLFAGAMRRVHKQKYEGMAKPLLLNYGKDDDPSFFAKLVRSLLSKYKG